MKNFARWYQELILDKTKLNSLALLFVRLIIGLFLILHGYGKIQSPFDWMGEQSRIPGFLQFLAALSEFGGGICIILGLIVPVVSLGVISTMLVASSMHLIVYGDPIVSTSGSSGELAVIYLTFGVFLILSGPGRYSADKIIFTGE